MRFTVNILSRAMKLKEEHEILVKTFGQESGLVDVFHASSFMAVIVVVYINQIIYRKEHIYEYAVHYMSLLTPE